MYDLKADSRAARFYEWAWGTDVTKFKTMCPYFWMYVLTIIILPAILVVKFFKYIIPESRTIDRAGEYITNSAIGKAISNIPRQRKLEDFLFKVLKWTFIAFVALFALAVLIVIVFLFIEYPLKTFAGIGVLATVVGLIYGLLTDTGIKLLYPFKLFGNMVYSLYKNMCPIVNWS